MRIENWCGYDIRFVEIDGEWWAILKDICDALGLKTFKIAQRLEPSMLERVLIDTSNVPSKDFRSDPVSNADRSDIPLKYIRSEDSLNDLRSDHLSKGDRSDIGSNDVRYEHKPIKSIDKGVIGKDISRRPGDNKTRWMLVINEIGIYEALFASRKLEARKFRIWAGTVMQKLRKSVGLEGYEVMRMTEPDIQDEIDCILDTLYWDEEKRCVMQSVTVQGGDVEQVEFNI